MPTWTLKPLGDVCTLQRGFDLPTQDRRPGTYPLVSSSGVIDTHDEGMVSGPGVVTGRSGSIGNVFYVEEDFWPLNTTLYVRDFHRNDPRFVYYLLAALDLRRFAGGTGVPTLNRNDVHCVPVQTPGSVDEQRRIVAILDEAFEGIATAKAHAEKNLRNAHATFESILETAYTNRVGESPTERLEALCDQGRLITYGVIKLGDAIEGGVPCLRTSNVRWLNIDTNGMKRIAPSLSAEYSRTILRGGEVLVNVRGTLGGVAVTADSMAGWNVSREVAVVPINADMLDPEYAAYWIGSRASQDWLSGVKKGAAYTGINIEDLRNLPVPLTSRSVQSQIVRDLKAARAATRRIEEIYTRKLAALDELKQSLLHQAFSGQL